MADGYNDHRTYRTAELFAEYESLVNWVMAVNINPPHQDDYYTQGYSILRQSYNDSKRLADLPADTSVSSSSGGQEEKNKRELFKTRLDAYSRRHEARKIYLWQSAARRTIQNREAILQGQRPQQYHMAQLTALDQQLRAELSRITDQGVFDQLRAADYSGGCWIAEDPGLGEVLRWFRDRR